VPRLTLGKAGFSALLGCFVAAGLFLAMLHASTAHAARGFETGLVDSDFHSTEPGVETSAFDRAVQARAGFVLIYVTWSGVAPGALTPGFHPDNPADPRYDFAS